jgi:hypothetical protein
MSVFENLKDDAERYAQQHPQQVKEGEQAVEKELGIQKQAEAQQDQTGQDTASSGDPEQNPAGQGQ